MSPKFSHAAPSPALLPPAPPCWLPGSHPAGRSSSTLHMFYLYLRPALTPPNTCATSTLYLLYRYPTPDLDLYYICSSSTLHLPYFNLTPALAPPDTCSIFCLYLKPVLIHLTYVLSLLYTLSISPVHLLWIYLKSDLYPPYTCSRSTSQRLYLSLALDLALPSTGSNFTSTLH